MNPTNPIYRNSSYIYIFRINKITGATENSRLSGGGLNNSLKRDGWKEVAVKGKRVKSKK